MSEKCATIEDVILTGVCLFCGGKLERSAPAGTHPNLSLCASCQDETCPGSTTPLDVEAWNLARATRAATIEEAVRPWREALTDDLTVFDYIVTADKTRYDYPPGGHGQVAKAIACKPDGTPPPTGQVWLTPKEKAEARIKELRVLLDKEGG